MGWLSNCDGSSYVPVRDIYRLEFELFESLGWSLFYASSVIIFATHMCLGWKKCVTSAQLDIPKRYQTKAAHIGWIMTAFVCLLYLTFPCLHTCSRCKTDVHQQTPVWSTITA